MKAKIIIICVMMLLITTTISPITAIGGDEGIGANRNLTQCFSFDSPSVKKTMISGICYDEIDMSGLPKSNANGLPVLPVKPMSILLPQHSKIKSVDVSCKDRVSIGKGFSVEIGRESMPIGIRDFFHSFFSDKTKHPSSCSMKNVFYEYYEKNIFNEFFPASQFHFLNEPGSFDSSEAFPVEDYSIVGTFNSRGYTILVMNVYPVRYTGDTGEIYYYQDMNVNIETCPAGSDNIFFRDLSKDKEMVENMVENPAMVSTYQPCNAQQSIISSIVNSDETYEYVIITSEKLRDSPAPYTFHNLVDLKNAKGLNATIVTVEEITSEPIYWDTENSLFNDTQAQIRNFIRDAYLNWNTEYVLLGGDGDSDSRYGNHIIPSREIFLVSSIIIPSDVYYSCLDGNFNSDGDIYWGEPTDGENGDEVDLMGDVLVGRAPVDNAEEMSNFVMKTIMYEYGYDDYFEDVLMSGEFLDFGGVGDFGGNFMDQLIDKSRANKYTTIGIPSGEYKIDTLYDRDWSEFDKDNPWTTGWGKSEIIERINAGIHIINHLGHSYLDYNMRLNNSDIDNLTNDKYFFVYSQGCLAGGFDNPDGYDCAAEHFTVKSSHGAFAGVWNTRFGFGSSYSTNAPSQCFNREFWDAIFGEEISEIGKANQDSKIDNIWRLDNTFNGILLRCCLFEITLFGDPELSLKKPSRPDHDISIKFIESYYVTPNEKSTINVTIINNGKSDESNILVNIFKDDIQIDAVNIDFLGSTDETVLSFEQFFESGIHSVSIDIEPVSNEKRICNNALKRRIVAAPDIAVKEVFGISPPIYVNTTEEIDMTVENLGRVDVEDIGLFLKVNDEIVDSVLCSLKSGDVVTKTLIWKPEKIDICNITIFIEVISDEQYPLTINNQYDLTVHTVDHVVYVDDCSDADFKSIEEAVYWIGQNDTVYVNDGIYHENVIVDKSVTLIGKNKSTTIVSGGEGGTIFSIMANWVNISGFTLQNSFTGIVSSSNYCNIYDNIFMNNTYGVNSIYSTNNKINNNIFQKNIMAGILFLYCNNNHIYDNLFENNICTSIYLSAYSNSNIIENNKITNDGISNRSIAIFLVQSSSNIISENIIENNQAGIGLLMSSNENSIGRNNLINNKEQAKFLNSLFNSWSGNYWDDLGGIWPKIIKGTILFIIPWLNFDWHPAREPYDIP